jgi:hypothetical protein
MTTKKPLCRLLKETTSITGMPLRKLKYRRQMSPDINWLSHIARILRTVWCVC